VGILLFLHLLPKVLISLVPYLLPTLIPLDATYNGRPKTHINSINNEETLISTTLS
jgi:hypothetical protein